MKRLSGLSAKRVLASCLALAAIGVAGTSMAGIASPRTASCTFNADGSGFCTGTLTAFRKSTDPTAQLILQNYQSSTGVSRYASVKFAGASKFVPLAAGLPADALRAFDLACNAVDANVFIHWNTSTQLDSIQLFNDSGLIP